MWVWAGGGVEAPLSLQLQGIVKCVVAKCIVQPIQLFKIFNYVQILGVSVAPMLPADLCYSFSTVSREETIEMKHILFSKITLKFTYSNIENQNISGMTPGPPP